MTVKPLSEEDLVAMCDDQFMTPGEGRCREHPTVVTESRLKELFAELKKYQVTSFITGIVDAEMVDWKKIEELFGPLVPK